MMLSVNFALSEFLDSQTASREGFTEQFNPPVEIIDNLKKVAGSLEVVRALLGSNPIKISSGYRCPRLNAKINGAKESAHLLGLAVDFTCPKFGKGTPAEVCRRLASTQHLEFDQIIYEFGSWCHFAVGPGARRQLLTIFHGDPTYHLGILDNPPGGGSALIS